MDSFRGDVTPAVMTCTLFKGIINNA
jgi:hypothetical protein